MIKQEGFSLQYLDANDVPKAFIDSLAETSRKHAQPNDARHISIGSIMGRRFRIYVMKDGQPVVVYTLREILDGEFGYGAGDFYLQKFVFPGYVGSNETRFAAIDLLKIFDDSGTVGRVYGFNKDKAAGDLTPPASPKEGPPLLDGVDQSDNPCFSVRQGDGVSISKMKVLDTEKGPFSVYEWTKGSKA